MDGLGAEFLVAGLLWLVQRRVALSLVAKRMLVGRPVAVLVLCSLLDASFPPTARMRKHAAVGRWIRDHAAAAPALAGNIDRFSLDTFYAQGKPIGVVLAPRLRVGADAQSACRVKGRFHRALEPGGPQARTLALVQQRITDYCGYRRVPPQELPAGEDEVMVFVRK